MSELSIKLGKVKYKNPVLVASGTFGYASEFEKFFCVEQLGGVVTKTITLEPRLGNPPKRIHETPAGMLNAIGLQNVGVKRFLSEKMPYLAQLKIPIIVSVMGYSIEEFEMVIEALDHTKGIAGFELNLSCPNVKYGTGSQVSKPKMFAHDANLIKSVLKAVRKKTKKFISAKLGPDVSDITMMAQAAESGGADGISLINTFRAMAIDIHTRRPVLGNVTGGLSGPCIRPIAIRMVSDVYRAVSIPIMGMGGITCADDALEFFIAGATAIQVGTANFINPHICPEIIQGLNQYLKTKKIKSIQKLIGSVEL